MVVAKLAVVVHKQEQEAAPQTAAMEGLGVNLESAILVRVVIMYMDYHTLS